MRYFAESAQAGAGRRTISLRCEEPGPELRGIGLRTCARSIGKSPAPTKQD